MPSTFSSINEFQEGGVPQFQQTQPVESVGGGGVLEVASLGASLFGQVQQAGKERVAVEGQSAVGGLQDKLVKIRQAGATDSSVNVVDQQRVALMEFNVRHPGLAQDATKAFKAATGQSPGGLSVQERAEVDLTNEAISKGFGYHGAPIEYNDKMTQHYVTMTRKDRIIASEVAEINLQVQNRQLHKSVLKEKVLAGAQTLFVTSSEKTSDEMSELVSRWSSGTLPTSEALMMIRVARNKVNGDIASLGEFSTNPVINTYSQPTLDSLQLAEDIVNSKIEVEAANATMTRNRTIAKAKFLAHPKILELSVATEVFPNVTGTDSKITTAVLGVLNQGLMSDNDLLPTKPKPVDTRGLDSGEQGVVSQTLATMFAGGLTGHIDRAVEEASLTLTGIAEHLNRNGMDMDVDDKRFVVSLLNTKGAMEALSPAQRAVVMQAMDTYVADVVDVAARESIITAEISATDPRKFEDISFLSADVREKRPVADMAELIVQDELIYWKLNQQFSGLPGAQSDIRKLNKDIADNITPSVTVTSKGLGVSFEEAASTFFPIDGVGEVKEEAPKEEATKTDVKAVRREKGISREELAKKAETVSPTSAEFVAGSLTEAPDLVNTKGTRTLRGPAAIREVERIEGELTSVQKAIVVDEGYVNGYYEDDRGNKTGGVGQTGKFLSMSFKDSFDEFEGKASKAIQDYDSLPVAVQASIVSAAYRGDLKASNEWVKLFNQGLYKEASIEFLNHEEYKERLAAGADGVTDRLERISKVIGNFRG